MAEVDVTKISKGKARLLMKHPFFASLLMRTHVEVTEAVELAATDGNHIYFNPKFLDTLSVEDTIVVLVHEVGHDSLLHSIRAGERNAEVWNMACDHAINLMLEDQGFRCPSSVPGGWLANPKYKGWSAERIYDDIRREADAQPQSGEGDEDDDEGDEKPGGSGGGKPGRPGKGKPGKGKGGWLHGDVLKHPAKSEAEAAEAVQRARQRVAAAATMARMAGKLTGDLERMVDELLGGVIAWTDVLRDFMLKIVRERENWTRRNHRFRATYLPTRRNRRMGPIVFIPDTSGSMWGDDLEKICSEMAHCAAQTQPSEIIVLWADTEIKGEQHFDCAEFDFKLLKPMGGGGTDMRVPLREVEKLDPQVVVLMTDGETPWPNAEPPFPLITICTTDANCPVGQVIRI